MFFFYSKVFRVVLFQFGLVMTVASMRKPCIKNRFIVFKTNSVICTSMIKKNQFLYKYFIFLGIFIFVRELVVIVYLALENYSHIRLLHTHTQHTGISRSVTAACRQILLTANAKDIHGIAI